MFGCSHPKSPADVSGSVPNPTATDRSPDDGGVPGPPMFGTFASPATIVEVGGYSYGATDDAGCGVPPGRGLRPPRKPCDRCHCSPMWTDARLRLPRGRAGRTHT